MEKEIAAWRARFPMFSYKPEKDLIDLKVDPEPPHCCVCKTTENIHKDGWYGYRCNSIDCVCF